MTLLVSWKGSPWDIFIVSACTHVRALCSDRCGDPKYGLSKEYSFSTAPETGTGYPLVLGVVADVGQTINSSQTIAHLAAHDPKYVTLIGDLT